MTSHGVICVSVSDALVHIEIFRKNSNLKFLYLSLSTLWTYLVKYSIETIFHNNLQLIEKKKLNGVELV